MLKALADEFRVTTPKVEAVILKCRQVWIDGSEFGSGWRWASLAKLGPRMSDVRRICAFDNDRESPLAVGWHGRRSGLVQRLLADEFQSRPEVKSDFAVLA